jgi:predicted nucleic-acid-binding protein
MIGLDTNVIIRYLVQDEPKQSKQANGIIETAIAEGLKLSISQVTLCEVVWVLERCYHVHKMELINVIKQLLKTQQIQVEHESVAQEALLDFEHHTSVDFSDCLIGRQNTNNGCIITYTFDKQAAKKLNDTFKFITDK